MRESSWGVGAALAVSVLCAAAAHVPYSPRAPLTPAAPPASRDVTGDACLRGGGPVVVSADVADPAPFTQVCRGGVHDGQTVT
ncbi:hypothetical protein [Streptomyces olivaceus]|uniref:hypothetical protein n=1 Tax=Streptomyces olivaceus TaxID=47716 RepID=UPI004057CBB0